MPYDGESSYGGVQGISCDGLLPCDDGWSCGDGPATCVDELSPYDVLVSDDVRCFFFV